MWFITFLNSFACVWLRAHAIARLSWNDLSYLTFTWKKSKTSVTKKLYSHMVIKASLKVIPKSTKTNWKIPTLKTSISVCHHPHTVFCFFFFGILSTQPCLHKQYFIHMWQPRFLQEIELECGKNCTLAMKKQPLWGKPSALRQIFFA